MFMYCFFFSCTFSTEFRMTASCKLKKFLNCSILRRESWIVLKQTVRITLSNRYLFLNCSLVGRIPSSVPTVKLNFAWKLVYQGKAFLFQILNLSWPNTDIPPHLSFLPRLHFSFPREFVPSLMKFLLSHNHSWNEKANLTEINCRKYSL